MHQINYQSHLFRNVSINTVHWEIDLVITFRILSVFRRYSESGFIWIVVYLNTSSKFTCKLRDFGIHLLAILEWCRSLEWSPFFSSTRVNQFSRISFYDSTHQLDIVICINQRAEYKSVHFLAVNARSVHALTPRRLTSIRVDCIGQTGIITVSLIELLGATTLLHQAVNELLTLWSFSLAFVPSNRDLWLVNLSEVFQIGRLSIIDLSLPVYQENKTLRSSAQYFAVRDIRS